MKFMNLYFINIITKTVSKNFVDRYSLKRLFLTWRAPPLKSLQKDDGQRKSCKMKNEGRGRDKVVYFSKDESFLLNFFNYWLSNLGDSQKGTRISRNAVKFG